MINYNQMGQTHASVTFDDDQEHSISEIQQACPDNVTVTNILTNRHVIDPKTLSPLMMYRIKIREVDEPQTIYD